MVLQVVAEHLFHEGNFAVGEAFVQEAGIAKGDSIKKPFEAMHQVLKEVSGRTRRSIADAVCRQLLSQVAPAK